MNVLRMKEVTSKYGHKSRTALYRAIKTYNFPKPVKLGERMVGWIESECDEWLAERIAKRDGQQERTN